VFVTHLATRAQEKLVLAKALLLTSKKASYEAVIGMRSELHEEQTRPVSYKFPVKSGFTLTFHKVNAKCEFEWDGTNKLVQIHSVVLWWMAAHWHDEVVLEGHGTILHCQTECRYQGPGDEHLYRAHPNYQGIGEWYNWAMVKFSMHGCFPSKILLFYRKHDLVVDDVTGAVTSSGIHAILHSCKYREGTSTKRTKKFQKTRFCSRWVAESIPKPLAMMPTMHGPPEKWPNFPLLRSVPVEALDEHVYVIEENPGIQEEWTGNKVVWAMHDQRTAWSKIFLSEENSFNATV
jgi:hypothetical protein